MRNNMFINTLGYFVTAQHKIETNTENRFTYTFSKSTINSEFGVSNNLCVIRCK